MTMNTNKVIAAIEQELANEGIMFNKAPYTSKLISSIVNNVLAEVKKATVTVSASGLVAPSGAVSGVAKGNIT